MNVAVVGLAYSHPYTYTRILQRMGHRVTHVWDDDLDRRSEFATQFGATAVDSPEAIPREVIDGVILAGRLPERIDHAVYFLGCGVPAYVGKPMATTEEDLARLGSAARHSGTPLLATSVLRYAPALRNLKHQLDQHAVGTILAARAVSAHGISRYLAEPHVWQDDPARGGGTVMTMGVHALEPLSVLVGPQFRQVWCRTDRRFHTQTLSEDVALMTVEWSDGLLGSVEVIGGVNVECYGVDVYGSAGVLRALVPEGGGGHGAADSWEEFGYVGTMTAFTLMCQIGRSPVPLEESEAITRALLAARQSAANGRPVLLEASSE